MEPNELEGVIELGVWKGRKQAFSGIAARCSAADAACLRELRESKKYRAANLTWDQFCASHLGISRAMADKLIHRLEEFGAAYFYLASMIQIGPKEYRRIAGSVDSDGLLYNGERIPLEPSNAVKLAEAVERLKAESQSTLPPPAAPEPEPSVPHALKQLRSAVTLLEQSLAKGAGECDRGQLITILGGSIDRLGSLSRSLKVHS